MCDLDGKSYSYAWGGPDPLRVGDRVWLPGPREGVPPFEAKVIQLGSTYTGRLKPVIARADS